MQVRLTAANAENAVEGGNTDDTDGGMSTDVKSDQRVRALKV
jgi:hypothetical protein